MNVFEMQGFLSGKCLPGDILINETTAEYLVRKLAAKNVGLQDKLETYSTQAVKDVDSERQRQREKGWDEWHDDGYLEGVLALGGAAYAISGAGMNDIGTYRRRAKNLWPFPLETYKPAGNPNRRSDLVRGAAMIIAEIDKIDRAAGIKCERCGRSTSHPEGWHYCGAKEAHHG